MSHHLIKFFANHGQHHLEMCKTHREMSAHHEKNGDESLAEFHKTIAEHHLAASENCIEIGQRMQEESGKLSRAFVPDGVRGVLPNAELNKMVPRHGSAPIQDRDAITPELHAVLGLSD